MSFGDYKNMIYAKVFENIVIFFIQSKYYRSMGYQSIRLRPKNKFWLLAYCKSIDWSFATGLKNALWILRHKFEVK